MTSHVLENHMNSDVLFPSYASEGLSESLSESTHSHSTSPRVGEDIFSDLHCKEPECAEYDAYESIAHLIEHYDNFHSFVPPGLFQ